ncbi:carotenoid oxygenase family protein [Streptomyces sp. GbtcB7]|uniref:carotenoid oxygenase family protein n=1 Tax=Streptomyces sp. GbtcB7 TaxID=2824752 RepID=UPI001C3072E9|nr:carotenoid oxygenase family protein [Streptomyces sp. GbtcB7]
MSNASAFPPPPSRFPDVPVYGGWLSPSRIEADVFELEVEGEIPAALNGRLYQLGPDPQLPNRLGDDVVFNGDGLMRMFTFADGHVDYRSRYVLTEKLKLERAARRSLFGAYRSPYTDDFSVRGKSAGTANTTAYFHAGKLLALKEDSLPVEMDPATLETIGPYDFGGAVTSETFSAHPRTDPRTGEQFFFGYEARGLATRNVAYYVADAHGKIIHEAWFEGPYCGFMHDFLVTDDYVVFPFMPAVAELDRIRAGGKHWQWDPTKGTQFAIMPRYGTAKDIRYVSAPPRFAFHFFNAHNDGTTITIDGSIAEGFHNPYPYPDTLGNDFDPLASATLVRRWTLDYAEGTFGEEILLPEYTEFPVIDDRFETGANRVGFVLARGAGQTHPDVLHGPLGLNTVIRYDFEKSQVISTHVLGPTSSAQEAVFMPRYDGAPEGDGYLLMLANRWDTMLNELLVLDTERLEDGPVATAKLPFRVHFAFHGCWVPEHLLEG